MRLNCLICGARDRREFYYKGDAIALDRPSATAGEAEWEAYLHLRDNLAGETRDLWQHEAGCGAWLIVTRDTTIHAVNDVALVKEAGS